MSQSQWDKDRDEAADKFCLIGMDIDREMGIHARLGFVKGWDAATQALQKQIEEEREKSKALVEYTSVFSAVSALEDFYNHTINFNGRLTTAYRCELLKRIGNGKKKLEEMRGVQEGATKEETGVLDGI